MRISAYEWCGDMRPETERVYGPTGVAAALCQGETENLSPAVIVVAHPDDETVGAGSCLLRFASLISVIHVTDGSPENLSDAQRAGFYTREEYAHARRRELFAALSIAGIGPERCYTLGIPDQGAGFNLVRASKRIAGLLAELRPRLVITHAYEGGHPDHDSTAFGVHAAVRMLSGRGVPPALVEFAAYHARNDGMSTFEFLSVPNCPECTVHLTPRDREFKERMIDCYETQRNMIAQFPLDRERYRPAPEYDYTRPPHPGKLFYEYFNWGMTGDEWRAHARAALETLGLGVTL